MNKPASEKNFQLTKKKKIKHGEEKMMSQKGNCNLLYAWGYGTFTLGYVEKFIGSYLLHEMNYKLHYSDSI